MYHEPLFTVFFAPQLFLGFVVYLSPVLPLSCSTCCLFTQFDSLRTAVVTANLSWRPEHCFSYRPSIHLYSTKDLLCVECICRTPLAFAHVCCSFFSELRFHIDFSIYLCCLFFPFLCYSAVLSYRPSDSAVTNKFWLNIIQSFVTCTCFMQNLLIRNVSREIVYI